MRSRPSPSLFLLTFCLAGAVAGAAVSGFGCAGVKQGHTSTGSGGSGNQTGSGGSGNAPPMPTIQGLTGISVSPGNMQLSLSTGSVPGTLSGTTSFTATGSFQDGSTKDITGMVNWSSNPVGGLLIAGGNATVSAPGRVHHHRLQREHQRHREADRDVQRQLHLQRLRQERRLRDVRHRL